MLIVGIIVSENIYNNVIHTDIIIILFILYILNKNRVEIVANKINKYLKNILTLYLSNIY